MFYDYDKVSKETGLVNSTPRDVNLVVKRIGDQDYSVKRKKRNINTFRFYKSK